MDALQHLGLAIGVAEAHVHEFDGRRARRQRHRLRGAQGLGRRERDVGQPLALQAQHPQLDAAVDEGAAAQRELFLVGQEGEEHAEGQLPVEHEQRPEPDHGHALQAEQQAVAAGEAEFEPARGHVGIRRVHHQAGESRLPVGLGAEELDGGHAAQGFEKVAGLARLVHEHFFAGTAQGKVAPGAQRGVQGHRGQRDAGQRRAVDQHQHQRQQHQQAVEQRFDEAARERALDLPHRAEA